MVVCAWYKFGIQDIQLLSKLKTKKSSNIEVIGLIQYNCTLLFLKNLAIQYKKIVPAHPDLDKLNIQYPADI